MSIQEESSTQSFPESISTPILQSMWSRTTSKTFLDKSENIKAGEEYKLAFFFALEVKTAMMEHGLDFRIWDRSTMDVLIEAWFPDHCRVEHEDAEDFLCAVRAAWDEAFWPLGHTTLQALAFLAPFGFPDPELDPKIDYGPGKHARRCFILAGAMKLATMHQKQPVLTTTGAMAILGCSMNVAKAITLDLIETHVLARPGTKIPSKRNKKSYSQVTFWVAPENRKLKALPNPVTPENCLPFPPKSTR